MSRLTDLLRQLRSADPQLGADLEKEITALTKRRSFGLVFERHQPEAVELPGQTVRRGSKVRVLPPRGETAKGDSRLWRVESFTFDETGAQLAQLVENITGEPERRTASLDDLVVVAEFDDKIFPGLVETGRVEHGGDKPFHTVINAENYHALEMLTYTHRGRIDAIYIDPPYNTGARDWKYNNDYVEGDDDYRHSKWLAFMERRLLVARELLNPDESVLIVTIDEKEYLRLGMLLEQTFPEARIQMLSVAISPSGNARGRDFRRSDEYVFVVGFGDSAPVPLPLGSEWLGNRRTSTSKIRWNGLMRSGTGASRADRPGMFYPIYISEADGALHSIGDALALADDPSDVETPEGTVAVFPMRSDGSHGRWQVGPETAREYASKGYLKVGRFAGARTALSYLKSGEQRKVREGAYGEVTFGMNGIEVEGLTQATLSVPTTQWSLLAHSAAEYGSTLLRSFLPSRKFPFPKSLYVVEDTLRFFVKDKPNATILDFFSGSGTTAHAVMRLNRQDSGTRQCISVTNNEVGADEQKGLRQQGLRQGDTEWEQWGICDYITKPRIRAAITGRTPDGEPIKGDYKFTDEFPMADGFEENAAFFTLTYESPLSVRHNRAFERIAPMLWMRAGSSGRIIGDLGDRGWDISEVYAVLENIDNAEAFFSAVRDAEGVHTVFVVTDDDAAFQMVCRELPSELDTVQLYESYLQNFEINQGRAV